MALADAVPFAVAHWSLDEASGTRVDSVGANDLTDNNTVGTAAGKFGNAADFESGSSESLSRTDNVDLSVGDIEWMIRCWVNLESEPGEMAIVGKCVLGDTNNIDYRLRYTGANGFDFFVTPDGVFGNRTTVSTGDIGVTTGTWYLIHCWHDPVANEIGIAVNGGAAVTQAHSTGVFDGTGVFTLGDLLGFGQFWDGLIDDVVILKGYILDATERTEDYAGGAGVAFEDWDAVSGLGWLDEEGLLYQLVTRW